MAVGLAWAVGASLCYGVGSVLQSAAAAQAPTAAQLDPRLLASLMRGWRYPAGLVLDTAGFLLSLVALRTLPLYAVQAVVASFLAVTAVLGVLVLGLRLRRAEVVALGAVVLGLTVVGLSAAPDAATGASTRTQWALVAAAGGLLLACWPLARVRGPAAAWVLGAVAGLAFGVVAIAARLLPGPLPVDRPGHDVHLLVRAPALYALAAAASLALVAYATALQRGSVVQATAPLVVGETVLPALAGLALLGDHARPGWAVPAAAGFVVSVGATVALSRFGEVASAPAAGVQQTGRSSSV